MGSEWDGCKPDVMTVAKSVSGGVTPVSGVLANDDVMQWIKPGEHGSTYGGNPLSMAVAKRAVEVLIEEKMPENSAEMGAYLMGKLKAMKSPLIKEVRGRGLFIGVEFKHDQKVNGNDLAKILFSNGLITKATHDYCIRLSPALVINKQEIDTGFEIFEKSVQTLEQLNEQRQ